MGICSSCEAVSVVSSQLHPNRTNTTTAKLIHQDGRLQEFVCPVKVSHILQKADPNPDSSFICNSDDMDFDDVVTAVGDDEDLRPGQLYFVLPLARLNHPLPPEEMAALAVKASAALMKNGGGAAGGIGDLCGCRSLKQKPTTAMFLVDDGKTTDHGAVVGGGRKMVTNNSTRRRNINTISSNGGARRAGGAAALGRRRKKAFTANLTPIEE